MTTEAQQFDLVIRGGSVVTAGEQSVADIGVVGEQIAQIGGTMSGKREIDARGKVVVPGGVDLHVHLTPFEPPSGGPTWCDDFYSGSRAAAAGGITTIGNMAFPYAGETLRDALARDAALAERDSVVDVVLHPVLTDPATQRFDEIPLLPADGHTSIKYFTSLGGFMSEPTPYLEAMRLAREAGILTLVHCEDAAMIDHATRRLVAEGKTAVAYYPRSRPIASEVAATARIVNFAEQTGAPTYIVHLSSAGALEEVRRGRGRGVPLYVETRPLYLYLTEERFKEPNGAQYVGQPPLRTATDVSALWHAMANGELDTLCTDHAPWLWQDKVVPTMDVTTVRPGVADLDIMLPMLFSEGVGKGRITLNRFVEVSSTNAAKLAGLFPRKGAIAPGADADLVIWDPKLTKPVRAADFFSNGDFSPYEGWEVTGWPTVTISRGEVIVENGQATETRGRGRMARRERTMAV